MKNNSSNQTKKIHEYFLTMRDKSQRFVVVYNRSKLEGIKEIYKIFKYNPPVIIETIY